MTLGDDTLLNPQETADLLHMSVYTLRDWRRRRKNLPFVRIGNRPRYRVGDVKEYIQNQKREAY